jgi:hypothetical protein
MKHCGRCKTQKYDDDFHRSARSADGLQGYCKQCNATYMASYAAREPDRVKGIHRKAARVYAKSHPGRVKAQSEQRHLRRKYGLEVEGYEDLKAWSNGGCAICGAPNGTPSRRLCVDHDHATGEVRGLLCQTCNLGLGAFKDSIALLKVAIAYLEYFAYKK